MALTNDLLNLILAADNASGPGSDGFVVTPSDTVNFTTRARSLYVGVGGDVTLVTPAGSVLTHKNVPAGAILPIATPWFFDRQWCGVDYSNPGTAS